MLLILIFKNSKPIERFAYFLILNKKNISVYINVLLSSFLLILTNSSLGKLNHVVVFVDNFPFSRIIPVTSVLIGIRIVIFFKKPLGLIFLNFLLKSVL